MPVSSLIIEEFIKNGYSKKGKKRVWQITNPNLLFATPEAANGFYNLKDYDIYRNNVIDKEIFLLKKNANMIAKRVETQPFNLIDMRCAGGKRAHEFIKAINSDVEVRYCPAGMHPALTHSTIKFIKQLGLKNITDYYSQTTSFDKLVNLPATLRNATFQKNVILMFGSTLALFEINDFLFHLSRNMFKNDTLIIGIGIRKGQRLVNLETYQDVSFNNWFVPLMRELGFKDNEVSYNARFGNSRIECFYTLLIDKTIRYKGKKIALKKGDEIVAAVIYKYYEKELKKFCKMYFSDVQIFRDDNGYVLLVCKK